MEIEKKFLVSFIPGGIEKYRKREITQTYISTDPTIRLRKSDVFYILTVKGKGQIAREELEIPLDERQYTNLLRKTETPAVIKTRYEIPIENGLTAELDVYHGELTGLFTVEVEFQTIEQAESFIPPKWFSSDISLDKRYKNTHLALYGMPKDEII